MTRCHRQSRLASYPLSNKADSTWMQAVPALPVQCTIAVTVADLFEEDFTVTIQAFFSGFIDTNPRSSVRGIGNVCLKQVSLEPGQELCSAPGLRPGRVLYSTHNLPAKGNLPNREQNACTLFFSSSADDRAIFGRHIRPGRDSSRNKAGKTTVDLNNPASVGIFAASKDP